MSTDRPRTALVLFGGGRGAYRVGVVRGLSPADVELGRDGVAAERERIAPFRGGSRS